jgi:biopolymer transport protein ExbB
LERSFSLRAKRIIRLDILQRVKDLLADNQIGEAMTVCRRQPSVMGRILLSAIMNHDRDREELKTIVEDAARQEVPTLDRYLGMLGTIAAVSPLLGLTGTVFGMIRTFTVISEKGIAHPSQLAGGISEALITTASGLVVAIPALIFYNYFTIKSDRLILEIEKYSFRLVDMLKR